MSLKHSMNGLVGALVALMATSVADAQLHNMPLNQPSHGRRVRPGQDGRSTSAKKSARPQRQSPAKSVSDSTGGSAADLSRQADDLQRKWNRLYAERSHRLSQRMAQRNAASYAAQARLKNLSGDAWSQYSREANQQWDEISRVANQEYDAFSKELDDTWKQMIDLRNRADELRRAESNRL